MAYDNINDLNETDRELLESILRKSPQNLTEEEKAILNSRRSYLSYPQRVAYKGIIIDDGDEAPAGAQEATGWSNPDETKEPETPAEPENNETTEEEQATPAQPEVPATPEAPAAPQEPANETPAQPETPYGVDDPNKLA